MTELAAEFASLIILLHHHLSFSTLHQPLEKALPHFQACCCLGEHHLQKLLWFGEVIIVLPEDEEGQISVSGEFWCCEIR